MFEIEKLRSVVFLILVFQLFGNCTANSYGHLVGAVGEIQPEDKYWLVTVYDSHGNQHDLQIPIKMDDQVGYDLETLQQNIRAGVEVGVVTGPQHIVRRLEIRKGRIVLPLLPSTSKSVEKENAIPKEKRP